MFTNEDLENALKYSHTIDNQQAIWAEWNINAAYNVDKVGNYRYRPGSTGSTYSIISPVYDPSDAEYNYTDATDSDVVISAGFDDNDQPAFLVTPKKKINLLYSLEDCLNPNRPRSGINKILYLGDNQYIDGLTSGISNSVDVSRRPRYYMASRYDAFKYWTSYRTQTVDGVSQEFGVALSQNTGGVNPSYYIYDAAPFVVYKDIVPANKVVVKMQTNVGEVDNGPFRFGGSTNVPDPLYGLANRTVPRRWAIQGLNQNNNWTELISFSESQTRSDGSPIIASDGTVEIEYGLNVPEGYEDIFTFAGSVYSTSLIPELAPNGYAYLYKESETDIGVLYVSDGSNWTTYTPTYSWSLSSGDVTKTTKVVKNLVDPEYFLSGSDRVYREFQFIKGIRVVVDTMNKRGCTFDLIEMSPRIVADITNHVIGFNVNKVLSDLGSYSIPTGSLLASTGSINIFDEYGAFNANNTFDYNTNTGSIIANYLDIKTRFTLYDIVKNIGNYDYYIPVKSLYSERIPQTSDSMGTLSFELRDLFYMLESAQAPEMLLTNVSMSYAITVLLDSIGFSNYTFKRIDGEDELIIPFFFVGPQQNVAEVLQQLAASSHSAMFFDEYNNFVVMSKNYLLPEVADRPTDLILYGQEGAFDGTGIPLPNIVNLSSQDKKVFNGGDITYTTRYIQRSIGSIAQAPYIDEYKNYVYKPVLLWEVAGQEATKTVNASAAQSSGYSLSAIPLKTDLSSSPPSYVNGEILNNVIDLGEGVYWLGNYAGYFYSGGEIIKFDAVEYSVAGVGTVWITNNQQYQDYFSRLTFNGKIYPTGRVRIYTNITNGQLKEHGRGQFGTEIVAHSAGIPDNSEWVVDSNVRGVIQNARSYLFNTNQKILYPSTTGIEEAGNTKNINGETYTSQSSAIRSTRNGIIKNFLANTSVTELETNYFKSALSGSVQSSALVFNGPSLPADINPADFVTYQYKNLDKPYKHFGTRMRIIGKIESGTNTDQEPIGLFDIYSGDLASTDPTKQVSISGGGGGLAFGLNKDTNIGYYFEIDALSQNSISSYSSKSNSASYQIVTSPVIQVASNVVTATLTEQHDFEVGDRVTVSGVVDDNRKSSPTAINGEYLVSAVSTDRKQFQYNITPLTTTSAISAASSNGTVITYVASGHNFVAGNIVTVTGFTTTAYNITGVISSVGTNASGTKTFVISTAITAGTATGTGTATYQNLTTISSTGGTVSRSIDADALISNVFLYKLVSGYNEADIIKKQLTSNVATLTTLRLHDLQVGEQVTISGVDATFNGTYEITAVTDNTISYAKTATDLASTDLTTLGLARSNNRIAIPKILWRGFSEIIVDDGKFTGQSRMTGEGKTTVYDMSVEHLDVGTTRQFYLYLNDKQIATVTDLEPLPLYNNIALFVRGSSRCMFENIFALSDNFSENSARSLQIPISQAFGDQQLTESQALNKYALSGIVQNTYLSGISSQGVPQYDMYYEEFGSIMREAAYFNIKYDKAYPALYSTLAKTLNRAKGYTVSGFFAGSYGAEFLIFNAIDKNINLDDTSGNYLRILGIAFTQDTTHTLDVDDFFKKNSNFINEYYSDGGSSSEYKQLYSDIVSSRNRYGRNDFSIQAEYLQTDAAAESMMDWTIKRVAYPRQTMGVNVFAAPHLQLGDIVIIDYVNELGQRPVALTTTRFVVYNISYQKGNGQSSMTVHLAEV